MTVADAGGRSLTLRFCLSSASYFVLLVLLVFGKVLLSTTRILSAAGTDLNLMIVPFRAFGFSKMREGKLPLWNPHNLCGTPFLANFQSALLYPPNWLHLIFPMAPAINWGLALHFCLAGWFTSLWCRARGLSTAACVLAGTMFIFSGAFLLHLFAGHVAMIDAMTWTPLILLVVDRCFERARGAWVLLGIFAVGMSILSGHPQTVYYTAIAVGIYVLLRLVREPQRWPVVAALASIYIGGALLSAMQLLPGLQIVGESTRAHGVSYEFASIAALPPENLLTLISPHIFDVALDLAYLGRSGSWEASLFIGVVPLLLAILGAMRGDRRITRWSALLVGILFIFALGHYTPLFRLMFDYFPGYSGQRMTGRFNFLIALYVAMLAGAGFDRLSSCAGWPKRTALVAAIAGIVLLGLGLVVRVIAKDDVGRLWSMLFDHISAKHGVTLQVDLLKRYGVAASTLILFAAIPPLLAAIALLLSSRSKRWVYAVPVIGVLELLVFAFYDTRTTPLELPYPSVWNQILATRGAESRVVSVGEAYANIGLTHGFDDVSGYDPVVLKRFADFIAASQGMPLDSEYFAPTIGKQSPLIKLLRAEYIFFFQENEPKVATTDSISPRASLVQDYRLLTDRKQILDALNERAFKPEVTVILEQRPDPAPEWGLNAGKAAVLRSSSDELEIEANLDHPSVLLITDSYSTGWKASAYPDGVQQRYQVLPANYTLRAIPLVAGKHHIRMVYAPSSLPIGRWITLVSLALFIAACVIVGWNQPRGRA